MPVPDFAATQTAMASSHPTPAYGNTGAATGGSPPLASTDPASGRGGRPRRRSRSLILAAVIGHVCVHVTDPYHHHDYVTDPDHDADPDHHHDHDHDDIVDPDHGGHDRTVDQ